MCVSPTGGTAGIHGGGSHSWSVGETADKESPEMLPQPSLAGGHNRTDSDNEPGALMDLRAPWPSGKPISKKTQVCPVCGWSPRPPIRCWFTLAPTETAQGTAVFAWPASLPTAGALVTSPFQGSLLSCSEKVHGSVPLVWHSRGVLPACRISTLLSQSTAGPPVNTCSPRPRCAGPSVHCFSQQDSLSSRSPLWSIRKWVSDPGALPAL